MSPDEATLRVWEEMRIEISHDEDGGDVPDELVDAAGDAAMVMNLYFRTSCPPGTSRIHVN